MKALLGFALLAGLSAPACLAQSGTVVFYSPSATWKSEAAGFSPKSTQPGTGWLSDGPQRLTHLTHGRFAAFHLKPGAHSFTVVDPLGPGKKPLVLNIQEGGQYCVRFYAKVTNLQLYFRWDSFIEEVPCGSAQQETAHLKPIEMKHVDAAVRSEVDTATAFPDPALPPH
jgi:hypothetical protein